MNESVIVTGFNDFGSLRSMIPVLLQSDFVEIIVAAEGKDGTGPFLRSLDDPRIKVLYSETRLGKMRALMRAINEVTGDVTYIVSSDTHVDPEALLTMTSYLTDGVGVVIPRVIPEFTGRISERIASFMWDVRNAHLKELDRTGGTVHGGEVMLVQSHLLEGLEDVINDDAYICLKAAGMGLKTRYTEAVTVYNRAPKTLRGLLLQRERVNLGHKQLRSRKMNPAVIGSTVFSNPSMFLRVMSAAVRKRRAYLLVFPLALALELLSLLLSHRDEKKGRDMRLWPQAL